MTLTKKKIVPTKLKLLAALLLLSTINQQLSTTFAQGTAFTYQGRLNNNGSPASGTYDFRFRLAADPLGNTYVGSPYLTNGIAVSGGLFTTTMDFGPGLFAGSNYWLEVDVRTNGTVSYTGLTPLQALTPTPYAIFAGSSSNLLGALPAGQLSGTILNSSLPASPSFSGTVTAGALSGNGGGLTNLNATQLIGSVPSASLTSVPAASLSGTVALAQLNGITSNQLNALTWQLATNLNGGNAALASNVVSGIAITNAFITNSVFAGNGGGLTNLSATQLTGVISAASLPAVVITNGAPSVTIGGTTVVAPLTVPPNVPVAAKGSVATGLAWSVAVAGSYAYVVDADTSKLQVFDVSAPSTPVSVGSVNTGLSPNCVAVAGRYAYVVNLFGNSLQVFDVSNPSAPVNVGSVGTGGGSNPYSVAVAGRYAYVVNAAGNNLQVFDVSTPSAPVSVGSVGTVGNPYSVAIAGRYAYVVNNLNAGTLEVFDVSTPSAPIIVGLVSTGSNPTSVAVAGRYAYVANAGSNTLQVFDVRAPSPVSVGSVATGGSPVSVAVAGRYAYVVNDGSNTLQVFDVSTPSAPVSVGSVGTGTLPESVAVAGRYAYVVNANVNSSTLEVFDLGGAYVQQLEAGALETGTLQTRDTATVGNNLDVRGGLTVSASARISGGLSVDNGTITAPNFNGNGSGLTSLNAAQLSGSVPSATLTLVPAGNLTGALPAISGASLTGLNASQLSSGVVPWGELPGFQSSSNYITVGGGQNNVVTSSADHAVISGGFNNTIGANDYQGTIAGGYYNTLLSGAGYSAIGGGQYNTNSSNEGTIAGGQNNLASGQYQSTVGGGYNNTASGSYATVPGGYQNVAGGVASLAAGARAQATNDGAFVWSDNSASVPFASTNNNSFNIRAAGGYRFYSSSSGASGAGVYLAANGNSWVSVSDRNAKKNFQPVDYQAVLAKLAAVPIQQWNYKWEKDGDVPNLGPMAQDFKHAFYPGRDDKGISTLEFDGVELAAIQGLNQKLEVRSQELEDRSKQLAAENAELKSRLEKLEQLVTEKIGGAK